MGDGSVVGGTGEVSEIGDEEGRRGATADSSAGENDCTWLYTV